MISADVLGERARLTPDALALVGIDPPLRLTYRELDERAARATVALRSLGLAPEDRVALLAGNRVEFLDLFFAAGKGAAVLVPIGTRLTAHEVAAILADSGARLFVYSGEFATLVETLRAMPEAVGIERWVALDSPTTSAPGATGEPAEGDERYAALVAASEIAGFAPTRREGEDLYCLLYTSGTTGRPKGVMIPHRQVAWNGYNTVAGWQLTAEDVSPIFTPLYHAGGLFAFLVPIFTIGGTVVLHRGFDPAEIWQTVARERCTVILGVPTIWKLLTEAAEFATVDLSSVRGLYSGGAPLPTWIAELYQSRGLVFKQGFGMTEVGVNCFAMTVEDSVRKLGSIGKAMMHTEVRLVDGEGRDVPPGEVGELWFRGPHLSLGYWRNPAATAAAYVAGGWFRSGDLARRDDEGFFTIAGRAKEMIISGGVNIYPAEIEAVLLQHPGVRDAAVVGIEHPTWGEAGVAFVVPLAPGSADAATLLDFVAERLARFKLPKEVVHLAELPRSAYGKVLKEELKARYLSGQAGDPPADREKIRE